MDVPVTCWGYGSICMGGSKYYCIGTLINSASSPEASRGPPQSRFAGPDTTANAGNQQLITVAVGCGIHGPPAGLCQLQVRLEYGHS